ncbi:ABC transporter permease [Oceanobacillus luteolus]|uniref:ABC transporter permease n=1 Tax=Oceanobacillus luteolus TaxID=1274358 RepID=A0ABW4HMN2_9BACI|nr:ABC transporter permease [Oceanobacillus luteolus]MCM3740009.1 ABC transporter permease [Oceanobacillus luteolus]
MKAVMLAQFWKDKRAPFIILLFMAISILLTVIFGDAERIDQTTVAIFSSESEEIEEFWEQRLNESSDIEFVIKDEEEAREGVIHGTSDAAVHVMEDDFLLIASSNKPSIQMIEQEVHQVFLEEAQLQAVAGSGNMDELRTEVQEYMKNPPIEVETKSLEGGAIADYDMGIQLLFGFTLFASMFTIGFKVNGITIDKASGVWNRMILSPVSKTSMYMGHLIYSFLVGFFQILMVLLIYEFLMGYDLGNFLMIVTIAAVFALSMVSVAMLIAGFVKSPEQFYMILPSILPIIPVVSGVYMMPGTITNPVLQFIGDIFPLSHAVEAMVDVTLFQANWNDILLPIVFMLLIGVVAMGIGINMVERRR